MRVIDRLYAREHAFVNISTQFHFIYFIRKCGDGNYPDNHTPIDVGEPRRSMSHLLSSSRETMASTSRRELQLPALAALSPFTHSPYPTMRPLPLELRLSDTSIPGLMHDVSGSLRVANLVAEDIPTSGDESSRPPTALDD